MKKFTNYLESIKSLLTNTFNKELKVISTFNGIGAFSEACRQINVPVDMQTVCEIDKSANQTYFHNFPQNKDKLVEDIRVLEQTVQKNLKLDVLINTPPCQSFSLAGSRAGFNSDNGNLFLTAINLQKKVDSNIVIYENVMGLVSHHKTHYTYENRNGEIVEFPSKPTDKEIKEQGLKLIKTDDLSKASLINKDYNGKQKSIGHTLHTIEKLLLEDSRYNYYWKVINSSGMGLPQNRQRIFIIGIKKDLDKGFKFPKNRELSFEVKDVLVPWFEKSAIFNNKNNYPLTVLDKQRKGKQLHHYGFYKDISYDADKRVVFPYISPCITTENANKFYINGIVRKLVTKEMQRVHGFSESYEFVGAKTQQHKQLGNTVSPGVYVYLVNSILEAVSFDKPVNSSVVKVKSKRGRKPKKTVVLNNHINVHKKITNTPDLNYFNLTEKKYQEYKAHLENGGTISMTVDKYETNQDKKNGNLECRYVVSITDLIKKGFRDKKNGIYRVRIVGTTQTVDTVQKNDVLIVRQGGKGKFQDTIKTTIKDMGLYDNKVPCVVDGFLGGGSLTLKNIEDLKFDRYIINDLEPRIYKTMLGVKKNYIKVIEEFNRVNNEYLRLRGFDNGKHIEFYNDIGHSLNDTNLDNFLCGGRFIFFMSRSRSGILRFNKNGKISPSCDNSNRPCDRKSSMIRHWSFILNKYNVEVLSKDIFELLDNHKIPKDSFLMCDGPYIPKSKGKKVEDYGMDCSETFQHRLKNRVLQFDHLLYFNENCKYLYKLGLHKGFDNSKTFSRGNKLGQSGDGGFEFMGYKSSFIQKEKFQPITNQNFERNLLQAA